MSAHPESPVEPPPAIREHLAGSEHAVVDLAESLVGVDTSNPPGETDEIVTALESRLHELGIETERFATDASKPNLLGELRGASEVTLLYNGHLDTVPFDASRWRYDPLGERDGDRLYGRGTTDMKGAIASMVHAMAAFVETGTEPPVTLAFAFVSDEEVAGPAGTRALRDGSRLSADACVIGEPTCEAGLHSVTVADKGSIWLTLRAGGTAAHGSRPQLGVNAIDRLIGAVEAVRDHLETVTFDLDPAVEDIVAESVPFYVDRLGETGARELFTKPTVNLGVLEGGHTVNRVPEAAVAELDIRLTAGVDTGSILAGIRAVVDDREGVTISGVSASQGTYEPVDAPVVRATVSSAGAVAGERIYRRSATGGGDAKVLRALGVETVEFAFATETAHAVDEYTTLEVLGRNTETYARLPYAYADATSGRD